MAVHFYTAIAEELFACDAGQLTVSHVKQPLLPEPTFIRFHPFSMNMEEGWQRGDNALLLSNTAH